MSLPTAPSRTMDQDTFDATTDAFIGALPQFETDMNALASAVSNGLTATSTTSRSVGTGSKTFTVQSGKGFVAGMLVWIADTSVPATNYMLGSVTSYSDTTLVVNVTSTGGSGTIASWVIAVNTAVFADSPTLNTPSIVSQTISGTAGNLYSSTYTPTITNGTNVAASTASSLSFFTQIGNQVLFDIPATIDPTATGEFDYEISLPVASTFATTQDAAGVGIALVGNVGAVTDTQSCNIASAVSGTKLLVRGYAADNSNRTWRLSGRYLIR